MANGPNENGANANTTRADTAAGAQAAVLSVRGLSKSIGRKTIVDDVSFDVGAGEVFGFLGPNGAGKTTTIRMLVGLIRPTAGEVAICGHDVHREHGAALRHVGSIVENPEMYPFLTGWENLEHFAVMLPGVNAARIREVAKLVGLDHRIHDKVKTYSLGMRQRLGIAQALLGSPKLLILDEPTNGLDPQGIKELRGFIRQLAERGMSLFISSHLLSEIQLMCDRVAIIHKGGIIAVGTVDELLGRTSPRVRWTAEPSDLARRLLVEDGYAVETDADGVTDSGDAVDKRAPIVAAMPPEAVPDCNRRMAEAGVRVYAIETLQPTLERLFLSLTEGEEIG